MNPSDTFKTDIHKWLAISDELNKYNKQTKVLRDHKKRIEAQLIDYIKQNNLENHKLLINDTTITYTKLASYTPISIKFIKSVLETVSISPSIQTIIMDAIIKERKNNHTYSEHLKTK